MSQKVISTSFTAAMVFLVGLLGSLAACSHKEAKVPEAAAPTTQAETKPLEPIVEFTGAQVTGVTMTDDGRLFASFPRWRENVPFSVVEIAKDGSFKPYPDAAWNKWEGKPGRNKFTCVQSVIAHKDSLYILDPSSPMMKGVVGKAKLHQFDLKTNKLKRTWEFSADLAPTQSYLNDLRVDDAAQQIYITDSGLGAILVLDLKSGRARRLLDRHASTKAEDITLKVNGNELLIDGQPPKIHSDGIAFKQGDPNLYYHALTGYTLYRVPTQALMDRNVGEPALYASVQNLGRTPAPDGMIFDDEGNLYMGDLKNNAVVYRNPNGVIRTLVKGDEVKWADTFTIDKSAKMLIFTASRIGDTPPGSSAEGKKFGIYRVPLAGGAAESQSPAVQ